MRFVSFQTIDLLRLPVSLLSLCGSRHSIVVSPLRVSRITSTSVASVVAFWRLHFFLFLRLLCDPTWTKQVQLRSSLFTSSKLVGIQKDYYQYPVRPTLGGYWY